MAQQTDPGSNYNRDYNQVLVKLNSCDRTQPETSTNSNFNISFTSTGNAINKVKKISVSTVSTNNLFYNVPSTANQFVINWTDGINPQSFKVTIPVGYYNAIALAAIVQQSVRDQTALVDFSCVFDVVNYVFVCNSGNGALTISIGGVVTNPGTNTFCGTLLYNMGYTVQPTPYALELTAPSLPSLNIKNIFLFSQRLASAKSYLSNDNNRSAPANEMLSIGLGNIVYGGTVCYVSTGSDVRGTITYNYETPFDTIDFQVRDEWGCIVESPFNNTLTIELKANY
jgi:hypothetical protein